LQFNILPPTSATTTTPSTCALKKGAGRLGWTSQSMKCTAKNFDLFSDRPDTLRTLYEPPIKKIQRGGRV